MSLITKQLLITDDTPAEICKADRAVQALAGTSRRQTIGLFDHGCVLLNGDPCVAPWQRLSPGDRIELQYEPNRRYSPKKKPPTYLGFEILFEDEHLIVVNKPAHCLTVPSPKRETNTLSQRVSEYLTKANRRRSTRALVVHRLDRGVSGVLVFAKTIDVQSRLRSQFEQHLPEREYLAIVAGKLAQLTGTFRSFLATSESLKRYSTKQEGEGELAITHYRVEKAMDDVTLVRVRLETGRRNQIRVHFAEAGHPVLGDQRYEHERAKHRRWQSGRIALHATSLAFEHPLTGATCRFEVPLPEEFHRVIRSAL